MVLGSASYRQRTLLRPLPLTHSQFPYLYNGDHATLLFTGLLGGPNEIVYVNQLQCAVQVSITAIPDPPPGCPLCKEQVFTQVGK